LASASALHPKVSILQQGNQKNNTAERNYGEDRKHHKTPSGDAAIDFSAFISIAAQV